MAVVSPPGGQCRRCQVPHAPDAQFCDNCRLYLPDETKTVERVTFTRRFFGHVVLESILVLLTLVIGWIIWYIFTAQTSQSPARRLMNTYLVKVDTGRRTSTGETWLRDWVIEGLLFGFLGQVTFGLATLADWIWPLFDKNRQALHDKVIGTVVVYAPQGLPESMQLASASGYAPPQPAIAQAAAPQQSYAPPAQAAAPAPYTPQASLSPADQTIIASAAPAATQDVAAQLRELRRLLDDRIITEEEYERKRADLARKL